MSNVFRFSYKKKEWWQSCSDFQVGDSVQDPVSLLLLLFLLLFLQVGNDCRRLRLACRCRHQVEGGLALDQVLLADLLAELAPEGHGHLYLAAGALVKDLKAPKTWFRIWHRTCRWRNKYPTRQSFLVSVCGEPGKWYYSPQTLFFLPYGVTLKSLPLVQGLLCKR